MPRTNNTNAAFNALLHTKVASVTTTTKVFTLKDTNSVGYAVRQLAELGIIAAPVMADGKGDQPIDALSTLDVISFLFEKADSKTTEAFSNFNLDDITVAQLLVSKHEGKPNARQKFTPVFSHNPASFLLNLFAKGVHRTVVFDEKVVEDEEKGVRSEVSAAGICSQSDMLKFLYSQVGKASLAKIATTTLTQMGYKDKAVYTVKATDSVLVALALMEEKDTRVVGVVDEAGKLVGQFHSRAVRGLTSENFSAFDSAVGEYISEHDPESMKPILVDPNGTFADALAAFVKNHARNTFVVDGNGAPAGIITQTDICNAVFSYVEPAAPATAKTALPVPGTLKVTVESASDLIDTNWFRGINAHVTLKFGEQAAQETKASLGRNPTFGEEFSFDITAADLKSEITLEVFDGKKSVGVATIPIKWVVAAFGTNSPLVVEYRDALRLGGPGIDQGELVVDLLYVAK